MEIATKLAEIQSLPVGDRIRLVQAIWDTIEADAVPTGLTVEQEQILEKRIRELDKKPDDVLTWEQIEAHVRRKR